VTRISEGRYEGSFRPGGPVIVVRVGRREDGTLDNISGDLFDGAEFLLSFLGHPGGLSEDAGGSVIGNVSFYSKHPLQRSGSSIVLAPNAVARAPETSALITLDLGAGAFTAAVERVDDALRTIRIEIDGLAGLPEPDASIFDGDEDQQDLVAALSRASIAATVSTSPFRTDESGRKRHTMAELHALMQDWSRPPQPGDDAWRLHVLFANRFDGRNDDAVTGIMYDVKSDDKSPARQGLAVFLNGSAIKRCAPPNSPDWRREVVFTLVHEIGHALNLPHAFEDRRAEALTWMNYPDRMAIGAAAFWSSFEGAFDTPELSFLRHAPFCDIAPGQYDYARRDSDLLSGGTSPFMVAEHQPELHAPPVKASLSIAPLKAIYSFGEPVFLQVVVTNNGRKPLDVSNALDPSDGYLSVRIRTPRGNLRRLRPPAALCQRSPRVPLSYRKSLSFDGIFASFDADGPIFDEPGRYEISAAFTGVADAYLTSESTYLRVLHPSRAEEVLAISIWDDPQLMRAIYYRQPLLARDSWSRLVDETARSMSSDPANSTVSYLHYIAAMGWLSTFAPASRKRKHGRRINKATPHMRLVEPMGLPGSVSRRKAEMTGHERGA
jgi:hypothetical protein